MSGQDSLAQSFMVLSFASAGLIGLVNIFDGEAKVSDNQVTRRAVTKSPIVLVTHEALASSISSENTISENNSIVAANRPSHPTESTVGDRSPVGQVQKPIAELVTFLESSSQRTSLHDKRRDEGLRPDDGSTSPRATDDNTLVRATVMVRNDPLPDNPSVAEPEVLMPFIVQEFPEIDNPQPAVESRASTSPSHEQESLTARPGLSNVQPTLFALSQQVRTSIPSARIIVDLSDRNVTLWQDGESPQTFPIAVGRAGWETPTGEFEVINKKENPTWQNPLTDEIVQTGPNNPLGTHWVGFWTDGRNQIGFHGTNQTDLLGQAVSHGCIRMANDHIQILYEQIALGTSVSITE